MEIKPNIDNKFFIYHKSHPEVFGLFLRYAREVKEAGLEHYSIDAIMHRVRWHMHIETKVADGFKLNNNYTSRYARLLVREYPEFKGFFRNRKLQTYSILEYQ